MVYVSTFIDMISSQKQNNTQLLTLDTVDAGAVVEVDHGILKKGMSRDHF